MIEQIHPISKQAYTKFVQFNFSNSEINEQQILNDMMKIVQELPKLVMGTYFWRIYSKLNYCMEAGGSVEQLTPYTLSQLKNSKAPDELMIASLHPSERELIYSFIEKSSAYILQLPPHQLNQQSINFYVRVRQSNDQYKWLNIQYPAHTFDANGKVTGGLIVYTDMTNSGVPFKEPEMLIIDSANNRITKYRGNNASVDPIKKIMDNIPGLSRRHAQVLYLMSKGKASKEIAAELHIAKNTVENHRQRMLKNFGAKSSIELIDILKEALL